MASAPDPLETDDTTIGALLAQLGDDARGLIKAEAALYRAEVTRRALSAGWAAGLAIGAMMLVSSALVALLVGLIAVLAPMIGTGWAVVTVTASALGLAAILGVLAWRQVTRMIEPVEL